MSRQSYPYATATATRHVSNHGTSSAFSSSANPDEDWTKISDLAERRRIQNRIAQRNYRKKLKRRLEDLERRAGSSSESPPQSHAELQQQNGRRLSSDNQQYKRSPGTANRQVSPRQLQSQQYTPPMHNDEEYIYQPYGFEREGSRTPPLFVHQSSYPAPEEISYQPYPAYPFHQERAESYDYMAPVTLPSMMQFNDHIKRESHDTLSPYQISYAAIPAIDIHPSSIYEDPTTPPLSHSYEHSASCSDSGNYYPTTPLSMPPSPRMIGQL